MKLVNNARDMTWRTPFAVAALAILLAGCDRPKPAWHYPAPSAATRPAAVPPSSILTPATKADIAAAPAAAADPAISAAVNDHLGPGAPRWHISAARDIGDYVLLWIGFPDVADGGIDLVYSKRDHRVRWHFLGGIRG
jgi:hypothetical protein